MFRKDREKSEKEALGIFDRSEYCVLSLIDEKAKPYCVPLNGARKGGEIFFHCAKRGKKTDALKNGSEVCLCAVESQKVIEKEYTTRYLSAVITGKAFEITDEAEKKDALEVISRRFAPNELSSFEEIYEKYIRATAVWKIVIDEVTGKGS